MTSSKSVIVIGGGLAGLSSAVALAEAGFRVQLLEKRPHLGGRATSYVLPTGEHVDNCQHVTMGCCTNLDDFYRRVGSADKIRYYDRLFFQDDRGRRSVIEASQLPPPLHLAPSFLLFPSLRWADKRAIARAMLAIARSRGKPADAEGSTMLEWLRRHRQTPEAIERFWRVVLVSALDEELDRTGATYGVEVLWKGFLANRRGFEVGIPSVPLAELYAGCRSAIEQRGGEVRARAGVREIHTNEDRVTGLLMDDEATLTADYYLAAVPHTALLSVLPLSFIKRDDAMAGLHNLRTSPITGVHLWFDRPVMAEPFLTLIERTTQWIFNKTRLYGSEAAASGQYLQLVISASYDLVPRSRQEIIELCRRELADVLPATRDAGLVRATVIKEVDATFSPAPDAERWRPPQRTALANLFLAGDWTRTGWPATMEGAVRSGYLAAEAILAAEGRPQRFLCDDLPVEGLARLWF
jgi:zeta-carotene desaturase